MDFRVRKKINDFNDWAKLSFEHYSSSRFADALTNMRKAGEAACRLIVFNTKSDDSIEKFLSQKSYKELIDYLIFKNLAPRKVINWLETFQIHGNIATHDSEIVQAQAEYGNVALKLLITWLFDELLNADIPPQLTKYLKQGKDAQHLKSQIESLQESLATAKAEAKKIETDSEKIKSEKFASAEEITAAKKELEELRSKIKLREESKEKVKQLERQLQQVKQKEKKKNEEELSGTKIIPAKENKKSSKKLISATIALLIIAGSTFFILSHKTKTGKTNATLAANDSSSFKIIIFPFAVLQDNPNILVKIEDDIKSYLLTSVDTSHIKLNITVATPENGENIGEKEALEQGKKANADIMIYGALYESAKGDSIKVNPGFVFQGKYFTRVDKDILPPVTFGNLTDARAMYLKNELADIIKLATAYHFENTKRRQDAINILNTVKTSSFVTDWRAYWAKCNDYELLKQYPQQLKTAEEFYNKYSDSLAAVNMLAIALNKANPVDEPRIEKLFERACMIHSKNPNIIANYAYILIDKRINKPEEAKKILLKAIAENVDDGEIYFVLAKTIEEYDKDYNATRTYLEKALEKDTANLVYKKQLGKVYWQYFSDVKHSLPLFRAVFKADSTDSQVAFTLGNIYSIAPNKNVSLADYYFKKSKKYIKNPQAGNYLGLGMAAVDKGDYKTALPLLEKSYKMDSTQDLLIQYLLTCYSKLNNDEKFYYYAKVAYIKDSNSWLSNFNLGSLYFNAVTPKYQNPVLAEKYFLKAFDKNPTDATVQLNLGTAAYGNRDFKIVQKVFPLYLAQKPINGEVSRFLGSSYFEEGNYAKAKYYLENAMGINHNDYQAIALLGVVFTQPPFKDNEHARELGEEALSIAPNNYFTNYQMAKIYGVTGDPAKGRTYYKKALTIDPTAKEPSLEKILGLQKK